MLVALSNANLQRPNKKGEIMEKYRPSLIDALINSEKRRARLATIIWYLWVIVFGFALYCAYLLVTN